MKIIYYFKVYHLPNMPKQYLKSINFNVEVILNTYLVVVSVGDDVTRPRIGVHFVSSCCLLFYDGLGSLYAQSGRFVRFF